jgi:hypothetical protein
MNVSATGLDQPHPLDLLENDGATDIHGSITSYSNTGSVNAVPEPSPDVLLACVLAALAVRPFIPRRHLASKEKETS